MRYLPRLDELSLHIVYGKVWWFPSYVNREARASKRARRVTAGREQRKVEVATEHFSGYFYAPPAAICHVVHMFSVKFWYTREVQAILLGASAYCKPNCNCN